MNKKIIVMDCITLGVSILFFILIRVLKDVNSRSAFDYVLVALLMAYGVLFTLLCSKEEVKSIGNAIIPIVLIVLLLVIYSLPAFHFYNDTGVQNSILFGVCGLFISRIFFSLSGYFDSRYQTSHNKMDLLVNTYTNRIAILILIVVTLFVVFNTIQPQIDVSKLLTFFTRHSG